ncbi:putative pentatricopeptide repeat-containing protein [Nymphaea thermarum]|nr:putative pentatricopeptide repeat-containing protein [Nymphaea thermarum]
MLMISVYMVNKVGFGRGNLRSVHVACLLGLIATVLMHARLRIRGLAKEGRLDDSKKYVMTMLGQGIQPCAATYVPVFVAFCREQKAEAARELLEQMKAKGFRPDELIHHFSN